MPGGVIGTQMGFGFPGQTARQPQDIVRNHPVAAGAENIYFGDPVVINADGTARKFGDADTAAKFAGVAARRIKQAFHYPDQSFGYYMEKEPCDVILRGNVSVKVNAGSPTVGSPVYIRTAENASFPAGVIGGFEAAADGTNTILLTNAKWATTADSNGVAELAILTQQGV